MIRTGKLQLELAKFALGWTFSSANEKTLILKKEEYYQSQLRLIKFNIRSLKLMFSKMKTNKSIIVQSTLHFFFNSKLHIDGFLTSK